MNELLLIDLPAIACQKIDANLVNGQIDGVWAILIGDYWKLLKERTADYSHDGDDVKIQTLGLVAHIICYWCIDLKLVHRS